MIDHIFSISNRSQRISWDQFFVEIAHQVRRRSTCSKLQVGAVVVSRNRILGTGYNGSPKGMPHCLDQGCTILDGRCIACEHAEENAILHSEGIIGPGHDLEIVIYCTHMPCLFCCRKIINTQIGLVCFANPYQDSRCESTGVVDQVEYLRKGGVSVIQVGRPTEI